MARSAVRTTRGALRDIIGSTADYEAWAASRIPIVQADLEHKHAVMRTDPFAFFRGTFYRWAELWPRICPDLEAARPALRRRPAVEEVRRLARRRGRLVWGVNDFDEAYEAAFAGDLVRLLASVILAGEMARVKLKDEAVAEILRDGWPGDDDDAQPCRAERRHRWPAQADAEQAEGHRPSGRS